ncbi:MAG TPA: hypothetical protein ENN13_01495 [Candidatus Altiarchaeales archaeon]|nr:hypothetical protein [Candidatus Altiarchaeales archaeon]
MTGKKGSKGKNMPLGSAVDVVEGVAGIVAKSLNAKQEVERKVEKLRQEGAEKVEELREDAIDAGYAMKKALLRTIIESILLSTAIVSLIAGTIMLLKRAVEIEYVFIGYGLLVLVILAFQVKTSK